MQNKILRYTIVFIMVVGLVMVRAFESQIFYDPFLEFFKGDYQIAKYPHYDLIKLLASTSARFWLNAALSILLVRALFPATANVKIIIWIFLVVYVLLIIAFAIIVQFGESQHLLFFYIRRFLIQPLLVMLLVPAFYYQKVSVKS